MSAPRTRMAAVALRVYGLLLRIHRVARSGYGPQMQSTFDARLRRAEPRGAGAILALLLHEGAGVLAGARRTDSTFSAHAQKGRRPAMGSLRQDLRYALRSFRRQPWLTAALVTTLALGIGANSAIFSVTRAVLFPNLPLKNPSRLVMVWEDASTVGFPRNTPAPGSYADWTTSIPAFDGVAAIDQRSFNLAGEGEPEKASGAAVTPNFFTVLGVGPSLGRLWSVDEDAAGAPVAVLSHELWVRRFGADAAILNRTVSLNGRPVTVLGIMPPRFQLLSPELQIWMPLHLTAAQLADRGAHYLWVVARLRDGSTLQDANGQLHGLAARLQREQPATNRVFGMYAVPLLQDYVGDTRAALVALLAAAGCVLLIACANVANLLLARATGRVREMTIRAALGADRRRLMTQLLTESLLLSTTGGVLGLLVAEGAFGTLTHLVPQPLSDLSQVSMDLGVVAVTAGVSIVTGVLFGLAPAWRASRVHFGSAASQRTVRGLSGGFARARHVLVVAEIALATVLLVCAALLVESFRAVSGVDLGFRPDRVLTLRTQLPRAAYAAFDKRALFVDSVLERVRAIPGVEAAGYTSAVPLVWKGGTAGFEPEGRALDPALPYDANNRVISPGYMETIGITLRAGRFFDERDGATGNPVAIINERMARQYWPGEDPLGRRFKVSGPAAPWRTIVGIVGETRVMGIDQATRAEMYFPIAQARENWMWPRDIVIRAAGDPAPLTSSVAHAVWALDRSQPVSDVSSMDDIVARELQNRRTPMLLMSGFAALALVLAAVGIYGVLAFSVAERTAEIGLRLALGGQPRGIRALFVRRGMAIAGAGLALGVIAAFWSTALLETLLFDVRARDPWTFAAQAVVLVAVCLAATYVPARRASRIDPIVALRED